MISDLESCDHCTFPPEYMFHKLTRLGITDIEIVCAKCFKKRKARMVKQGFEHFKLSEALQE